MLFVIGLFLLALLPRALNYGTFLTVDEAYHWFERSESFLRALRHGDYAGTFLVGHPGVTTMWLGAIGIRLHQILADLGWVRLADADLQRVLLRLPVAVVTSLSITLAYPLVRRLLGTPTAVVAVMLWATEPFLVAHSQLLHTDALLTSFMNLAILAALGGFGLDAAEGTDDRPVRWHLLIAAGIATGLAFLTKSPAILVLPIVGLIALVSGWRARRPARRFPLVPLVVWGGVALVVCVALWPAMWVNPVGTIVDVLRKAREEGGTPHDRGNFFLGQTVADPGPLFYPVALALRMTPWTLVGLILGCVALARSRTLRGRPALGLIAIFALFFLLALSFLPKKFDRYALPIFPAVEIIAAAGIVQAVGRLGRRWHGHERGPPRAAIVAGGVLATGVLVANLLWYHPYELSYYNPLLGGGQVAARTVPVGWGEGYDQAGAYIMAQGDCDDPVAVRFGPVLSPFLCNPLTPLSWGDQATMPRYAVLSIHQIQRGLDAEATAQLQRDAPLLHTVRIHSIDYASIYEVVPPLAQQTDADFGPDLHLRGYEIDSAGIRTTGVMTATLQWRGGLKPLRTKCCLSMCSAPPASASDRSMCRWRAQPGRTGSRATSSPNSKWCRCGPI